jgi:hypothetical protein
MDSDGRRYEFVVTRISPEMVMYSQIAIKEPRTIEKSTLEEKVK